MNRAGVGALSLGILVALLVGAISGTQIIGLPVITACLCVATFFTIGGLQRDWHTKADNYRTVLRLLVINLVAGSVPMAAVGLAIGPGTPAGRGFLALAAVPVAAGIPAYASALGVPAERISLFALTSYLGALLFTPLLLGVIFGTASAWRPLLVTVFFGLVVPSVLGVLMSRGIRRIQIRTRRSLVISALLVAMVGLGGVLEPSGLTSADLGAPLGVVVVLGLLRAPIGGLLGIVLNRRSPFAPTEVEAALAGGYKNCALAGASAIASGVPAAAVPGALGLISEAILLGLVGLLGHRTRTSNASNTESSIRRASE